MKYAAKKKNKTVGVIDEDGVAGFYLYIYDFNGNCVADHVQDSFEKARHQAEAFYQILPSSWEECP